MVAATVDTVCVWDLEAEDPASSPKRISEDSNRSSRADFSPDGQTAVSISLNEAELWDTMTGERIDSFEHSFNLSTARFSPDGGRILVTGPAVSAAGPVPGSAVLWDAASRKRILDLHHPDQVKLARMSSDGTFIVTLAKDDILRVWHADTGQLVSKTSKPYTSFRTFRITPDGRTLVFFSNGKIWLRPMPLADPSIPDWLPELADAVAGQRLDDQGNLENVPPDRLQKLREDLGRVPGDNHYSRFARWFVADRSLRTLSPESNETTDDLITRLLEEGLANPARRALRLDPDDARLFSQLGQKTALEGIRRVRKGQAYGRPGLPETSVWQSPAEWYTQRAIRLSPNSPEAWIAHTDTLLQRNKDAFARETAGKIQTLFPNHPEVIYLKALLPGRNGDYEGAYWEFKPQLLRLLTGSNEAKASVKGLREMIEGLSTAAANDPRNWSELAMRFSESAWPGNTHTFHADWLSHLAMELAPGDPLVAVRRAAVLRNTNRGDEAQSLIEDALQTSPASSEGWFVKAQILTDLKRNEESLRAVNTSLHLNSFDPDKSRRALRLKLLSRLGLGDEARKLFLDLNISKRPNDAGPDQIDLSPAYNAALAESWMPPTKWRGTDLDLASIPQGLVSMDSVLFDVRGIVQARRKRKPLSLGPPPRPAAYPPAVTAMETRGRWRTLHFLHGASGAHALAEGDSRDIGHYLIRYADGRTRKIPIVLGRDLWHWVQRRGMPEKTTRANVAWKNDLGEISFRLFHSAWENPFPDVEITHIDLVSEHDSQFPFLVAVTGK